MLIDKDHPSLSITCQCELLGLSRSGYYYRPQGLSDLDLALMHLIDEEYTRHPFYGSRRMRDWLKDQGSEAPSEQICFCLLYSAAAGSELIDLSGPSQYIREPHILAPTVCKN